LNTLTATPRTIQVVELTTRMSERSVGHAAAVSRDVAGGVHLNMTAAAAEVLGKLLNRVNAMSTISATQVVGHDRAFWETIADDLWQACSHGAVPPNPATYTCVGCGWALAPEQYGYAIEAADAALDHHAATVVHDMRWPITFVITRPLTALPEATYRQPVPQQQSTPGAAALDAKDAATLKGARL
jgi:hypothetical protein